MNKDEFNNRFNEITQCPKANYNPHSWMQQRRKRVREAKDFNQFVGVPYELKCNHCGMKYQDYITKVQELYANQ